MTLFDEYMKKLEHHLSPADRTKLDKFRALYYGKSTYAPDPKPTPKNPKKKGK